MRSILFALLAMTSITIGFGQDITGDWHGYLKEFQLRVVYHISKNDKGYSTTLDSPDQGAKGIPTTKTIFQDQELTITATAIGARYSGTLRDNRFEGTFSQGGVQLPLILTRESVAPPKVNRPQEPNKPYPYHSEEVSFRNKEAQVTLAGTLTLPKEAGKFPAVILITGSGPQDRNEELAGHKPFLVIADHLTRNGIAVLRYDDRGFGKSTGNFEAATSADLALDVKSALEFLRTRKEIDTSNIGLIGHSEGGLIAPMVASKSNDVAFIIMLAGPGIRGDRLLLAQQELIARAAGTPESRIELSKKLNANVFQMVQASGNVEELRKELTSYLDNALQDQYKSLLTTEMTSKDFVQAQVKALTTPWMIYFMKHDPAAVLEKTRCPILVLNGSNDLQVPPKQNLAAIEEALKKAGNKNYSIKELANLNHLFQESTTGSPTEYGTIEETFAPMALDEILDWIQKQLD